MVRSTVFIFYNFNTLYYMNELQPSIQPLPRDLYLNEVTQASILALTKSIRDINLSDRYLKDFMRLSNCVYTPKPIILNIDSYGGDAYAMLGFLNVMDTSTTPIHTVVTGCAMSCGFLIAINGSKRFCHKYSTFMYHQVSYGTWGKLEEMKKDVMEGERLMEIIYKYVSNKTKIKESKLRKLDEKHTDWYISAEDSVKFGVVDSIIE